MKLFKASLWSSVLTVCGVLTVVSAAPQSLLAGRVPSDGGLRLLRNIESLSPFLSHPGLPAFSLVRAVPTVNSFPAVQQTPRLSQAPLSPPPPVEDDLPARYNFGYSVADLESGDSKSRQESREGDLVTGSYTVADPDGRIRTVTYTADSEHGFQAKVTYDGEEGPVAIPFNTPTETEPEAESVIVAKEIDQPLPQSQSQPQSEDNDDELAEPEVKTVESKTVPSLLTNGLRLAGPLPAVFNSVPRVFSAPQTLANIPTHSFPHFFAANSPRFVSPVPRTVNTVPRLFPSLQALLHNNLHPVQGLPHGVAVRAGAAPLDLSQFTFLSNGQVVG